MNFQALAEKLIHAETDLQDEPLLKNISEAKLLELAFAVKDISYEFWTSKPARTEKGYLVLNHLANLSSGMEISALAYWIKGISNLTKGRNEEAVRNLDAAAKKFLTSDKEHLSVQIQNSKVYALALLGEYDKAIETAKNSLKFFKSHKDDFAAGKIEHNIGNIYYRQDAYKEAVKYYISARKRYLKLNDQKHLAMIENSLAVVFALQNNFRDSEKLYLQSKERAIAEQMFVTQAEIEASMGNLALFRGRFDEALKFLESSRQRYETLKMPHQSAVAELEIADIYLELNLTAEAFEIYQKVTKILSGLKMQGEEARARANFGRAAIARDEKKIAGRELKKAARLYLAEKNPVGAATVKLHEAQMELAAKHFRRALKIAREAETLLSKSGNVRHKLNSRRLQAEALLGLKQFAEAEILLKKTFGDAKKNEQLSLAQTIQTSLGKSFAARKNFRQAAKHFQKSIELAETLRAPLPAEEFRMAYFADKLAPFEELAKIYLAENKIRAAFLLIERARARALAESLGDDLNAPQKSNAPRSKELAKLREELNWFYSRLDRAENSALETLQKEVKIREKKIAGVMRQIESTSETAARKGGANLDFDKLQKQLGAERALIEFVCFDQTISAFVVTGENIEYVENLAREDEIQQLLEGLRFQFGALRYGAKNLAAFLPQMKKRADFYLAALYDKLLRPLEKFTAARHLTIAPVRALHYVPFHALSDGAKYVVETREINYAPGATVWQFCQSKPHRPLENALLIAYADEKIPLVNAEIEHLQKSFLQSKTLTGAAATFSAFTAEAKNFDVLHLACHGEFRPDNPLFSSLHLADGWVTVRDICAQRLKAELVTLSACETGLNSIFAGDEILGLARGFLTAGATSLVLSLWTVSDEATTELMKSFYKNLRGGKTVAAALRAAQIAFVRRNFHPYFWSPFALIGR